MHTGGVILVHGTAGVVTVEVYLVACSYCRCCARAFSPVGHNAMLGTL